MTHSSRPALRALCSLPLPHPRQAPWLWSRARQYCSSPSNIAALLRHGSASPDKEKTSDPDPTLTINAFARSIRKQKKVAFAALGDGSSLQTVQAVLTPDQAEGLSTGAAVAITGQWTASPGKEQTHELHAERVRILGQNDATTYPIQKKYQTSEFLRTLPHLRSRLPFNALLLRLRSQVTGRLTAFFASHDFVQTHPPIITSSDCEGAGEVFTVAPAAAPGPAHTNDHFFQTSKYLTVSTQLHLEALAQSVGKVWTLSPTFRAEKSDTPRHLSEFYMLEAEVAFVEELGHVMDVVESMIRDVAIGLQASHTGEELLLARDQDHSKDRGEQGDDSTLTGPMLAQRWQRLISGPWPRIAYAEAIQTLKHAESHQGVQFKYAPEYEGGLQTEHERYLADNVGQGGPVFVTDYPRSLKPFYMAPSGHATRGSATEHTVACFDLLVPEICELVGGSMRESRFPELLESMNEHGLIDRSRPEAEWPLQWYLDLRRYGSVPHGGFGMGFDRLLCYLSGVNNIRDMVSFPRYYRRCDC